MFQTNNPTVVTIRINRIELKDLQYSFRMFSTSFCTRDIKRPAAPEVPNLLLAQTASQQRCHRFHANVPSQPIRAIDERADVVETITCVIPKHLFGLTCRKRISVHRSFIKVLLKASELEEQ
jgi:hypothetical protein